MSVSSAGYEQRGAPTLLAQPLRWLGHGVNLPLALGALAFAVYAGRAGAYELRLLSVAGAYAILVIGYQFIFSYAGAASLAQSCFFGLGAYVTGVLGATYGFGSEITLPLSILAPGLLAAAVAGAVLRLEDHYFSLATLAITLLVTLVVTQWLSVTGGTNGLSGIPSFSLFGQTVASRYDTMLLVWGFVVAAALLALLILRGLYGRAFHLMRQSRPVASALGLDTARMRFSAFVLSGCYGGLAGALTAHVTHVISPEQVGLPLMITCLTMTVIGGRLSIAGGILGALLITHLQEQFRFLEYYAFIAYGVATLTFLVLVPNGIVGSLEAIRNRLLPTTADPIAEPAVAPALDSHFADQGETLLEVDGVSKAFGGIQALSDVGLALRRGEIVGLIGPNGSGKTTLINIISGLYDSDAGRLTFAGHDISRLAAFRIARLGMMRTFQHIHLVDEMSVLDNIALGWAGVGGAGLRQAFRAFGRNDSLKQARDHALTAARALGVDHCLADPCGALPYGTRRRVEVARALIAAPKLLLLDEPAAGLNEEEQRDLAQRIKAIAATGTAVLVVEHNLVFLAALAERLVCLDQGRVIAAGLPTEVRADLKVIEAYLGTAA